MEEIGIPGENHRPDASDWQNLSYNVISSTPPSPWAEFDLAMLVGIGTGVCRSNYHDGPENKRWHIWFSSTCYWTVILLIVLKWCLLIFLCNNCLRLLLELVLTVLSDVSLFSCVLCRLWFLRKLDGVYSHCFVGFLVLFVCVYVFWFPTRFPYQIMFASFKQYQDGCH